LGIYLKWELMQAETVTYTAADDALEFSRTDIARPTCLAPQMQKVPLFRGDSSNVEVALR